MRLRTIDFLLRTRATHPKHIEKTDFSVSLSPHLQNISKIHFYKSTKCRRFCHEMMALSRFVIINRFFSHILKTIFSSCTLLMHFCIKNVSIFLPSCVWIFLCKYLKNIRLYKIYHFAFLSRYQLMRPAFFSPNSHACFVRLWFYFLDCSRFFFFNSSVVPGEVLWS